MFSSQVVNMFILSVKSDILKRGSMGTDSLGSRSFWYLVLAVFGTCASFGFILQHQKFITL